MLAIRLQRVGRKGYPTYRVIVQEAQRSPKSGRVVAFAGSYNPHTKEYKLDHEKIEVYLKNGAQPSPRVVKLLLADKIKLPAWVEQPKDNSKGKTRFPEKLRKNQPEESPEEKSPESESTDTKSATETSADEKPKDQENPEEISAEKSTAEETAPAE